MSRSTTRRTFLKRSLLAAGGAFTIAGTKSSGKVLGANDSIRIAVAGVNGRGLNDGTARGHEPVESFWLRQATDGTGQLAPRANQGNPVKMLANEFQVDERGESQRALLIQVDQGAEETPRAAEKNDADINAFAALNVGDKPHERVVIRVARGHEGPPLQKYVTLAGDLTGK